MSPSPMRNVAEEALEPSHRQLTLATRFGFKHDLDQAHIQRQGWVVTRNTLNGLWMGRYRGDLNGPIKEFTRAMKDLVVA